MTVVAIHQPEYFPWPGFLDKARRADVFVLLDNVQFDRDSLQHRCKVVGANGLHYLTIPFVHRFPQAIDEVMPVDDRWRVKHWKSLQANYARAPGWRAVASTLEAMFHREHPRVVDAALASITTLAEAFGVTTPLVRASALAARGEKGALVLEICRELGATTYLSGRTGASYLDASMFAAAGIAIEIQAYTPPPYPHIRGLGPEERYGVSALDLWAHVGADAPSYLGAA